jgi:hypothetical protein
MRIWFAGNPGGNMAAEPHMNVIWRSRLWSYFVVKCVTTLREKIQDMQKNKVDLFIDSGAFSAFTQKTKIDIQEYIEFIKDNLDVISVYANLDVIGDPKGTLKNQRIMEKSGLKPLPCFHFNEPIRYLELYIKEYEYIALGGMVPISTPALSVWLDGLFSRYICDKDGMPKVKVHGFGLTTMKLMLRYSWFSVDSTSWVMNSRMGSVYVPKYKNGIWQYSDGAYNVCVSSQSPSKKDRGHISTLPKRELDIVLKYFDSLGYSLGKSIFRKVKDSYVLQKDEKWSGKAKNGIREIEIITEYGLSNDYHQRDEFNVLFFKQFQDSIPAWPREFHMQKNKGFGLI